MTLNAMQRNFVFSHLRRPENDLAISNIVKQVTLEANKSGFNINPEYAEQTALLMNLGETHPDISYIYDPDFSWKEHPEAKDLNSKHGEYSIKMAQEEGIELTPEQMEIISGHSQNKYPNVLALIIKSAEICRATEFSRWSRGEKKGPATSFSEVASILKEEGISPQIINVVSNSYGKNRFNPQQLPNNAELEQ